MVFKASLDRIAKVFSTCFTTLLLGVVVWQVSLFLDTPQMNSVVASLFLLGVLLVPFYYHPISYCIKADHIIIRRPFKNVVISKQAIESIRIVDQQEMKGTLRSFGVAGLYGYFGRFSNRELGSMLWYATQRRNYVLIQTRENKRFILTPDQPAALVKLLHPGTGSMRQSL